MNDNEKDNAAENTKDNFNDNAINQVWQLYHQHLFNFINKRVSNHAVAEDILQDVMQRVIERIDSLKDENRLKAWLFQITRNTIIDYYRSHKESGELPDDLVESEADKSELVHQEIAQCLLPMIQSLPDDYRNALMISEIEGGTQKQVAEIQGLSLSGAKSRIQRGRVQLKQKLSQCCEFEFDRQGSMMSYRQKDDDSC